MKASIFFLTSLLERAVALQPTSVLFLNACWGLLLKKLA